jgi:UDP-N-acetylglucosamine acyltransferase
VPPSIHPSAVVDPAARLGDDVQVGPFCVVGGGVELGDRVKLLSHVVVEGRTRIGAGTVIYPFASIGHAPQDKKFAGEPSELLIGTDNVIREHVTMNPGTEGGGMVTRVGDRGLFMMGVHIAHDCQVGNDVIMANHATLAGHVIIGDHAVLGGLSAVLQYVRIGAHAMIGGLAGVEADVIPFGMVKGDRAYLAGLNLIGLERRGFARDDVTALRTAFKTVFEKNGTEKTMAERIRDAAETYPDSQLVSELVAFLTERSARPLTQPR